MTGAPHHSSDVLEILRRLQSAGFCLDLDASADPLSGKMDALFEQILRLLFKEISRDQKEEFRLFPVLLGDGRRVDLLRLYSAVVEKGGYRSVTATGTWSLVADEAGLDSAVGTALKLIYAKYLRALDRRLQEVPARETEGEVEPKEEMGSLFHKTDEEDSGLSFHGVFDQKAEGDESIPLGSKEHLCATLEACNGGDDHVAAVFEPVSGRTLSPSLKRKRESLVSVLDWLRNVAKSPGSTSTRGMPIDQSKNKCTAVKEPFSQVLLAREAMFEKPFHTSGTDVSLSQKRHKADPSMYNNSPVTVLTNEKLRCSQRIISLKKLQLASSSEADDDTDRHLTESESEDMNDRKCITIGPEYQAKIPEWTDRDSAHSNSSNIDKFLGTQLWPLDGKEQNLLFKQDPIGRGRTDVCSCEHRGSVECIRFHVAEKRFHLKRELGSSFYNMGFHHMGEEVSLSWTKEEEEQFKSMVFENPPSLSKSFWDPVFLCFPSKTRESLVSYYFNVFIFQRRRYQNRVTPKQIDSDDDESEFGFLCNSFGRNAVGFQDPKSTICVQNAQCVNLDDSTDTDHDQEMWNQKKSEQ